jgi:hypothetical protein
MSDVLIRLQAKHARNLLAALLKGVFDKLTNAECSALEDFITDLLIECGAPHQ